MQARPLGITDLTKNGEAIENWLADIVAHASGEYTVDEIKAVIERGSHTMWAWCEDDGTIAGIFITTIVNYSGNKCFSIVGAAGSLMDSWDEASDILLNIAKHMECVTSEMKGRLGLAKRFKATGWEPKYITLSRAV